MATFKTTVHLIVENQDWADAAALRSTVQGFLDTTEDSWLKIYVVEEEDLVRPESIE